ncbi:MAG TPA: hypothetical protein VLO11_15455 [Luteolibacter sp.]|nr:hypothetical protein [Luteolibacter sp.]
MKITPTVEGGLRIDAEDAGDWFLLLGITRDAAGNDEKLAQRLGALITDEELSADWQDIVVPELEAEFHSDLAHVAGAIREAEGGGGKRLWITREDAWHWYSALNQARLALHEIHHFQSTDEISPADLEPGIRNAFLRSQFYCAFQSLLLDHVMR